MATQTYKKRRGAAILIVGLIVIIGFFIFWQGFLKPADIPSTSTDQSGEITENIPAVDPFKLAADETLGSGFAVKYPDEWANVHLGASQPQSTKEAQVDTNTITSPSGKIQVTLAVHTLAQHHPVCRDGYITLKYLQADPDALPGYNEGRFAAYVVYFPDYNLYQYHIGLQKNTQAIRNVNVENNTACNFMFSEFIEKNSSLPNVPVTTTTLSINFVDLVSKGQDLKPGITEAEVAGMLTGIEYEQAKAIVRSVHLR